MAVAVFSPYADRKRRATELMDAQPHAREVLTLARALLDVQERAFEATVEEQPSPSALTAWVGRRVLPDVVAATMAAGPDKLAAAVPARIHSADLDDLFGRWLRSEEQSAVDRYLARACLTPALEALGAGYARRVCAGSGSCPHCGGLPQLAYSALSGEALVTGPRYLQCARCSGVWTHTRMTCAACGETATGRLPIYEDPDRFPPVRIEGCETCRRYLLSFDLRKDTGAVPLIDELAMLPLDLYSKERGMTKVVPNLMGF